MPAELSVPITSRADIQNGGKDADSTIQSELGLVQRALRQLATEYSESSSENQRSERMGNRAHSRRRHY
jgi:hypothetical protein